MDPNQQQPPGQSEQTPSGTPPNQFPNQPASFPSQPLAQPHQSLQIPPNQASGQQFHQPPVGDIPPPIQADQNNRTPGHSRPPSSGGSKLGRIIGIVIGAIVLVVVVGALLWFFVFFKSGIDKIADAMGMDCFSAEIQFKLGWSDDPPAKQALKCEWEGIEYGVLSVEEFREYLGEVFKDPEQYTSLFTREDISGFCAGEPLFNNAGGFLADWFSPVDLHSYSEVEGFIFIQPDWSEYESDDYSKVYDFEDALEEEGFMPREIKVLNINICDYESPDGNSDNSGSDDNSATGTGNEGVEYLIFDSNGMFCPDGECSGNDADGRLSVASVTNPKYGGMALHFVVDGRHTSFRAYDKAQQTESCVESFSRDFSRPASVKQWTTYEPARTGESADGPAEYFIFQKVDSQYVCVAIAWGDYPSRGYSYGTFGF